MKCPGEKELEMLLYEMLDANEAAELKTHLKSCAECGKKLDEIRRLDRALRDSRIPPPGDDYWRTLAGRTANRYERSRRAGVSKIILNRAASAFWALTEAAAALLAAATIYYFSNPAAALSAVKPGEDSIIVLVENMETGAMFSGRAIRARTNSAGESINNFDLSRIENL